ncbi:MAG TPA: sigma-70 family RNA polymerase sigma factor [Candidatus Scatovivens faecipullorum]|nr:sigma-70 family RNA polymerase sigma factor [Candidatus Scatovivens faecipullorum]
MNGLIWNIVKRFLGRGYEADDLYQIACIGFIEAIQRFKFEYNVKLSTYSVQYMIGEIKKFLRDDGIIRISRSVKELGIKIKELEKIYMAKTGESLCITRLSEILELPEETIYMAMEAMQNVESINAKVDSEGKEIVDLVSTGIDEQAKIVDKITILDMIKKLNSRDRQIINLRYFKDKTQTQVAKILGISQVHVSRIEKKILNEFRNKLLA